jgi:hypothetical protein
MGTLTFEREEITVDRILLFFISTKGQVVGWHEEVIPVIFSQFGFSQIYKTKSRK